MLHAHDESRFGAHAPIRALLLDDSDYDRQRIQRLCNRSRYDIDLEGVPNIQTMSERIQESSYDVIMLDYNLPDGDGLKALGEVHMNSRNQNTAIIMITGQQNNNVAMTAMKRGCHDYVEKGELSSDMLEGTLIDAIQVARQRQQRIVAEVMGPILEQSLSHAFASETFFSAVKQAVDAALKDAPGAAPFDSPEDHRLFLSGFEEDDNFLFSSPAAGLGRSD